jgi:hypothetical protein
MFGSFSPEPWLVWRSPSLLGSREPTLLWNQLLREHVRQRRGWYRIQPEDHSKRTPLRVSQLLWRAGRAGTYIGILCEAIHRQQGEVGVRRILGVLSLAKKYGAAATDEACAAALEMGVQEYRFVRRYLERCPQAPLSLQQVDPLIRELVQYRDLIHQRTKELQPTRASNPAGLQIWHAGCRSMRG